MDVCVVSHGGCCSNQLVDLLEENDLKCRTLIWETMLCHYPCNPGIDIPVIYIYGNPTHALLSVRNRGDELWKTNQRKLSQNKDTEYSDENLLQLMLTQFNNWTRTKQENVLVINSKELFQDTILKKLELFLNKKLKGFPVRYIQPKLHTIHPEDEILFLKYKEYIDAINNFSV